MRDFEEVGGAIEGKLGGMFSTDTLQMLGCSSTEMFNVIPLRIEDMTLKVVTLNH